MKQIDYHKQMLKQRRMNKMLPYLFISPALIFFAVFMFYPIANVFFFSFQRYTVSKPYLNGPIGLENFQKLVTSDKVFRTSLLVSLKWVVFQVSLQLFFGLITALVLNKEFRGRGIIRAFIFAPWAVSGVITSMLWSLIYNEHMGVLNDFLLKTGIIDSRIAWLSNTSTVFPSLLVAALWRGLPFFAIMLLAGLQGIDPVLYEASAVDGTTRLQDLWYITLPQLKQTILLSTLLRIVWEFNAVDIIYNLTGGGPTNSTMTLTMYLTQTAIRDNNFGYGSAIAVFSFLFLTVVAVVYIKLTGFNQED